MRILLDTNIIIHREASMVKNRDIGLLFNWIDRLRYEKCIHPLSIDEIACYQDEDVVNTMKVKIENYNLLKTESPENDKIRKLRELDKNQNDYIDTSLLKEVYNNRVEFLITEDRGIHRKAKLLGIPERIYRIDTFLEKCIAENPELTDYKVLSVKKEYFGNIDLNDDFFQSFIEDYSEFKEWFNKKADNISYVCITDQLVRAFLYLKVEDVGSEKYADITPEFSPKKRLKIGTFKVTSTGLKLGERFLKIIFDNAIANKVDEIYVTIFDRREEQQRLICLLRDWGFSFWGEKSSSNGNELVFVRNFERISELENPRKCFPFVSLSGNQKFIVPIYPVYHTELFPDSYLNNESPQDFVESQPHRNAVRKVYISRSINRNLRSGDLVLFYRTGGHYRGVISTLGVVENVITNIRDESHFIELCRKRSVFNDEGLKGFWNFNPRNRPFIVNFLYVDSFPMPKVNLSRLRELGIVHEAPRGFEPIENDKFVQILKEARANENYFVD